MTIAFEAVVDARGHLVGGSSVAIVPWWSFTKTLIAACALRLGERGQLDLDSCLQAALALDRLLSGELLAPALLAAMLRPHPLDGPLPERPWQTTGYGLGLMLGTMLRPGMPRPVEVAGHSAGGPGSCGAVYRVRDAGTAAVFVSATSEGVAEGRALALLSAS